MASPLSAHLGQLLRELDRDQTHRLSGTQGATPSAFEKSNLDEIRTLFDHPEKPTLILLGTRGERSNSDLKLERVLRLVATDSGVVRPGRAEQGRPVDAFRRKDERDDSLAEMLFPLLSDPKAGAASARIATEAATAKQALGALMQARGAAFVVQLRPRSAKDPSIETLVVLPDTLRISISGDAGREEAGGDLPSRSAPPPNPPPVPPPDEELHRGPIMPPPDLP